MFCFRKSKLCPSCSLLMKLSLIPFFLISAVMSEGPLAHSKPGRRPGSSGAEKDTRMGGGGDPKSAGPKKRNTA
jgi:hypothetical protein